MFRRPRVAQPYVQSILGPQKCSTEFRPFAEDYTTEFMKQQVLQFDPSNVGKLLTGPKNTGKTFLNNAVLADMRHLNVNFRGLEKHGQFPRATSSTRPSYRTVVTQPFIRPSRKKSNTTRIERIV